MSSGKKPIPSNKKKIKKKAGFPLVPVLMGLVGMVIAFGLMGGGYYVWKQRQNIAAYNASIASVTAALNTHDPETTAKGLKVSEIEPLIQGKPLFRRETKDGVDYLVYTWREGTRPVGIRLTLEKNGDTEEVVELSTLGLD